MSEMRPGPRFSLLRPLLPIVLVLAWSAVASAQNVNTNGESLSIHGFINATAFLQNQNFGFGNGQNAEFPVPPQTKTDRWFLDGDVRNTRLTFVFSGPKLENDMKVGATLEGDFFGGFNGTGGFSNAQQIPRIRLGFIDLVRGKTTFRLGQAASPFLGNIPVSYTHIAFPIGYGSAGVYGWRFPGIYIYQDLTPAGSAVTSKFSLGIMRNTWAGPGDNVNSGSAGQASTLPQVEARMDWGTKTWSTYIVGHVDKKDLSGAGVKKPNDSLTAYAGEFGAKVTSGPFMLQGNAMYGKAIGQQFGEIAQFGDIKGWAAYVQGGYNFTKRWSGYLFVGMDKPKKADVLASGNTRTQNQIGAAELQYNLGPYGFSVEWLHDRLTTGATDTKTTGDQFALSAIYKF